MALEYCLPSLLTFMCATPFLILWRHMIAVLQPRSQSALFFSHDKRPKFSAGYMAPKIWVFLQNVL